MRRETHLGRALCLALLLSGCAAPAAEKDRIPVDEPAPGPPAPRQPAPRADAGSAPRPDAGPAPVPAGTEASLMRGINLGNALDAPREGTWGITLTTEHFRLAKEAGFDHVRLPVRWSAHAATTPPYAIAPAFLARVDWAVDQALAHGLSIVVDCHHYEEIYAEPEAQKPRFLEIWKQVAARLRSRPPHVVLELLNEPRKALTAELWNAMLAETIAAIRAIDPTRLLVVEGVDYAAARELRDTLVLPDDPNLIGSFHLYAPHLFTHQAAENMGPEYGTKGVVFPGPPMQPIVPIAAAEMTKWVKDWFDRYNAEPAMTNPGGARAITDEINRARTFVQKTGRRVYVGEFGVNDAADEASRVRWLRMAREEMERRGFGWAVWNISGGFALYDAKKKAWNEPLRAALFGP